MSIITLTTDYGNKDYSVSVLKAKIYNEISDIKIIDISHNISPFNLTEAAYIIKSAYKHFPKNSIHIIGIESEFTPENTHIAMKFDDNYFIGADNGIFSMIIGDFKADSIVEINIHKNYNNVFVKKPDVLIKSHSGPIDLIFYNKKQFPAELYGDAFVALHGSWNSSKPQGYMVIKIPFKDNKPLGYYETFVTGFWISGPERANICGRPAGLGITIDGSLLISDDLNNTIWHVHYVK